MLITEDNELLFSVLFERDFSPQDTETLLGFKPNNGRHVCVPDGENLTDSEIRKMIDNIVFERCEIHLH